MISLSVANVTRSAVRHDLRSLTELLGSAGNAVVVGAGSNNTSLLVETTGALLTEGISEGLGLDADLELGAASLRTRLTRVT